MGMEGTCDSMLWSVSVSEEVIQVAELSALPLFCSFSHEAESSRTGLSECILQMQTQTDTTSPGNFTLEIYSSAAQPYLCDYLFELNIEMMILLHTGLKCKGFTNACTI